MVVFAAQGDPRRTMALLWRADRPVENRPGPRPGLTVDVIVEAAVAVADAEGMAGLSMRAVGERLGRTAMALYTYVADKSELLDLMFDHVHAEMGADRAAADWRTGLTRWSEDLWAFYLRHPWVLQVSGARPVLGPHENALMEGLVRILRGTGLPAPVLRGTVGALVYFVQGAARGVTESRQAAQETGQSDEEWWYARSPELLEVAPDFGARFPSLVWLEEGREVEPVDEEVPYMEQEARVSFTVGLTVLLDGIEATRVRHGGRAG
ncbi:TetR/AcrR family transcriptional regulator C-terminal domain-containing protein [Actinokineospora sp. NBRC 105648]|uniref:TetR/AcrR family transcriptional regulator C-terminal domain-containing protein n=1 Tax=Actinokineospora sp. NBRC 105648 TaxID=3032206 RepID=UPI0024A55465|nr:TetR/AcrR family transcriptional regulator C-terminal domain-containing protein [Actinokineospora sp. NBRC 105648]GLZ36871.1 TetR family transcriptional regulator [Actinokineospora sp. NBRC 105648]